MNNTEIGKRLREIRKRHHLTIGAVAEMIDINETYWGEIERGKVLPSLDKLATFLSLFDVSADYILYGILPEEPHSPEMEESLASSLSDFSKDDLQMLVEILDVYCSHKQNQKKVNSSIVSFGKRLRAYRKKQGVSIKDLAEKTGFHRSNIQRMEISRQLPTLNNLDKIAKALNMPIDWILANSILAGRAVMLKEIIERFNELTPDQQEIARNMIAAISPKVENK